MINNRLWRPAAQRSVRNAWGDIQRQQTAWSTASANARSAATNLVNAYLSQSDVGAMDLGVLADMEGILDKTRIKLRALQEKCLFQYLESYDALVNAVFEMRNTSASMRTYVKDLGGGPLIEFTKNAMVNGDAGDGGGVAVFGALPLRTFEMLATDLVSMLQAELRVKECNSSSTSSSVVKSMLQCLWLPCHLKIDVCRMFSDHIWLLAAEFHNLVYPSTETTLKGPQHPQFGYVDPLTYTQQGNETVKLDKSDEASPAILNGQNLKPPSRETLQVYLTALLAEVHINKDRISEVSRLWSEEMTGSVVGSPQR